MQKNSNSPASGLSFSESEVAERKRWLELTPSDEALIEEEVARIVGEDLDSLIESMYAHFLSFEDTRSFFPDDNTLKRAQAAQKAYFVRFLQGNYDKEYVDDRLRVGSTHHRIQLDPKWYIGAYNRVLSWFLPRVTESLKSNPVVLSKTVSALMKLVFFDMGLEIECYINAKETSIRAHRDVIRELETERRVTKSILESAPIGIVRLSAELVCEECNDEFMLMIGADERTDVIGNTLTEVAPGLDLHLFQEVIRTGQPHKVAASLIKLSDNQTSNEMYWDWATWPMKDDVGKAIGLVAMFSNVTDRVLLHQQREDFVATLTHDLKTPVSATNRAVQFLLDGDFGALGAEQREILETILQSNTALYGLVQTLLDVFRFDSGVKEMFLRKHNLGAVISQIVTEIMPLAQEKGVALKTSIDSITQEVLFDEAEIRRVVQNLIDNSLKFTPPGGSITVTMIQDAQRALVTVSDTGKGIPDENKPKLFQRFWQSGSTGRYYASTGLGLYLCRRIMDGHNGRIWCESQLGKGSTFSFELPMVP